MGFVRFANMCRENIERIKEMMGLNENVFLRRRINTEVLDLIFNEQLSYWISNVKGTRRSNLPPPVFANMIHVVISWVMAFPATGMLRLKILFCSRNSRLEDRAPMSRTTSSGKTPNCSMYVNRICDVVLFCHVSAISLKKYRCSFDMVLS